MKILIYTLLYAVLIMPSCVFSCESGSQYRLFPLGMSEEKVVCLELDQFRDGRSRRLITWRIMPNLITLAPTGERKILLSLDTIEIGDTVYLQEVQKLIDQCRPHLKRLTHFEEIQLTDLQFGDFEQHCGPAQYWADTLTQKGWTIYNLDSLEFYFPEAWMLRFYPSVGVEKGMLTDSLYKEYKPYYYRSLGMASFRRYETGDYVLTLFTLGKGDRRFGIKNRLKNGDVKKSDPLHFAYNEPILHHGVSLDVLYFHPR